MAEVPTLSVHLCMAEVPTLSVHLCVAEGWHVRHLAWHVAWKTPGMPCTPPEVAWHMWY